MSIDYEDIKMQNCAGCGKTIIGKSMGAWYSQQSAAKKRKLPPVCRGYIMGRPYCSDCLSAIPKNSNRKGGLPIEDVGPSNENAVRSLEDG